MVIASEVSFVRMKGRVIDMAGEDGDEDNVLLTSVVIELPHPRRVLLECGKCSERHGVVFTPHSPRTSESRDT